MGFFQLKICWGLVIEPFFPLFRVKLVEDVMNWDDYELHQIERTEFEFGFIHNPELDMDLSWDPPLAPFYIVDWWTWIWAVSSIVANNNQMRARLPLGKLALLYLA
jgi:hypothetical protein